MVQHQVKEYFPGISKVNYEGAKAKDLLAFREYNPSEVILGKTMEEWCRFSVCYWHGLCGTGLDQFGGDTHIRRSWNEPVNDPSLSPHERLLEAAKNKADAAFELLTKLNIKYYAFHDTDLASEGANLAEFQLLLDEVSDYMLERQNQLGLKCLWGIANLSANGRFMNGAGTNPDINVFARAAAHVKKAMEITQKLGGQNYVFWGGREGYQSILTTDMKAELDHMAALFKLAVNHKKQLGATFQLLIEPKPREPMKHMYDYDAATVIAFLRNYGLEKDFKLNIEPNHTMLAGHDYEHDLAFASSYNMLGSVDYNNGDPMLGWDTDLFLMDEKKAVLLMQIIVKQGGLAPGGLNFDAKVRRESTDLIDMFVGHVGSMDCVARALRQVAKMQENNELGALIEKRYASWKSTLGERIEKGEATLEEVAEYAKTAGEPELVSGKQELAEVLLTRALQS